MFKKSITLRWLVNNLGIIVLVLVVLITALSYGVKSYVYNGIQNALMGRSDELLNVFSSSSGYKTAEEFNAICRAYIENFPDKNDMEIMLLSEEGDILITSTGFEPDQSQKMPDYIDTVFESKDFGQWVGELDTGEKVLAITRVVHDSAEKTIGSVRYLVSMERADQQIFVVSGALTVIGIIISSLVILSGVYFIRSIVIPVKQVTTTAQKISNGEFDVRIEKKNDDELGLLVDTINEMAGELGTAEKMKNDFISSISHELRTPLTAIKGWAETLHDGETDAETYEKGMNVIIRESERLTGIVEELLDFSRIQSGRMSLNMQKIDLLAELDEAVYMFTDRARTENKRLIYDDENNLPPVIGDINRLRQVFVNILDNALKYTREKGEIHVNTLLENGYISVIIADTGCGIPAKHLPNIKKKFYKANQLVRGSGIGLAVADEIITLHSGTLNVSSREGIGTTVTIKIPTRNKLKELADKAALEAAGEEKKE